MECTVSGEYGWDDEHLIHTGMPVETEVFQVRKVIPARLYEKFVEAVHEGTVAADVQVGTECPANELSFPAGDAEIAGRPPCGGGLSYFVRHATEKIFAISTVAYDVIKPAGELAYAGLKCHKKSVYMKIRKNGEVESGGKGFCGMDEEDIPGRNYLGKVQVYQFIFAQFNKTANMIIFIRYTTSIELKPHLTIREPADDIFGIVANKPDWCISRKMFHAEFLQDFGKQASQQVAASELPQQTVSIQEIGDNYLRMKQEAKKIVQDELERIMNMPGLEGLIVKKGEIKKSPIIPLFQASFRNDTVKKS